MIPKFFVALFIFASPNYACTQETTYHKTLENICGKKLVSAYFCAQRDAPLDKLSIVMAMMRHANQSFYVDGAEDSNTIEGYSNGSYEVSVAHWSKKTSGDPSAYHPVHPDTLRKKQVESEAIVRLLYTEHLIDQKQQHIVLKAIRANRLLHPWYTLAAIGQLMVQESLAQKVIEHQIIDSLKTIFSADPSDTSNLATYIAKHPKSVIFTFNFAIIEPKACLNLLYAPLSGVYPDLSKPKWRIETEGFTNKCKIPVQRNAAVLEWPMGLQKPCEIEFNTHIIKNKTLMDVHQLTQGETLPDFMLQLEQNQQTRFTGMLLWHKKHIRDQILSQLGIPPQDDVLNEAGDTENVQFAILRLEDAQRKRLYRLSIPLFSGTTLEFSDKIVKRSATGLTSMDRERFWNKLQASGLMEQYSLAAQCYLWSNLSALPLEDSLEMIRQMFLAEYPDPQIRLNAAFELYQKPISSLWPLDFLQKLSNNEFMATDFGSFKMEQDLFSYKYLGDAYQVSLHGLGGRIDLRLLESFASVWREKHPSARAFYFIPETKGYILYLSEAEAEKFSASMNLLIRKM